MLDSDKELLLKEGSIIMCKLIVKATNNLPELVLTENNAVKTWVYNDERYVPNQGFIGQFVARTLEGELHNIGSDFNIENREIELILGVKSVLEDEPEWYSLGTFIVNNPEENEVNDNTKFQSMDYTKLFNKSFNGDYTDDIYITSYNDLVKTTGVTALWLAKYTCAQVGVDFPQDDFTNADFSIKQNPFQAGETCRDVMKEIGKLAYSWVRIGWDNKCYIDFEQRSNEEIETYNKITNNEYFTLDVKPIPYGPINNVVIGMSGIDGESHSEKDSDSISQHGEHTIYIYDNPLTNTFELRILAQQKANKLFGLTYHHLTTETIGHPWLKGNDRIEVVDMNNNSLYTYPFNITIEYSGHIRSTISSMGNSEVEETLAYESDVVKNAKSAKIKVDKQDAKIEAAVEAVTKVEKELVSTAIKSGVNVDLDDASDNALVYLEIEGKGVQKSDDENICTDVKLQDSNNIRFYFDRKKIENDFVISFVPNVDLSDNSLYMDSPNGSVKIGTITGQAGTRVQKTITLDNNTFGIITDFSIPWVEFRVYKSNAGFEIPGDVAIQNCRNKLYTPYTENNKLTSTSERGDHYWETGYKCYLEAGETYTMSFKTDINNAAVEMYIFYDYQPGNFFSCGPDTQLTFVAPFTAYYRLRYDINNPGVTASFWDFQVENGDKVTKYKVGTQISGPEYPSEIKNLGYQNLFAHSSYTFDSVILNPGNYNYVLLGTFKPLTKYTIYNYNREALSPKFIYTFLAMAPSYNSIYFYNLAEFDEVTMTTAEDGKIYLGVTSPLMDSFSESDWNEFISNFNETMLIEEDNGRRPKYIPFGKYGIDVEVKNATEARTMTLLIDEPLRALSENVKDKAYIKNNKLYVDRKIGTTTLRGGDIEWYDLAGEGDTTNGFAMYNTNTSFAPNMKNHYSKYLLSDRFKFIPYMEWTSEDINFMTSAVETIFVLNIDRRLLDTADITGFKKWLSTHPTRLDYELNTPIVEDYGIIDVVSTFKGNTEIRVDSDLEPNITIEYTRDTQIADYVESRVAGLVITEKEISESVENMSVSVDGLNTTVNRVEEITNETSQTLNIISTNIDRTTGEVREVTTTTGFTFNANGMQISDQSGFKAQHSPQGTYYKDGESVVGQYTKDGSKQKDLELFGTYSYGKDSIDATAMFVGQLYHDAKGEECFGHFYNGGGY